MIRRKKQQCYSVNSRVNKVFDDEDDGDYDLFADIRLILLQKDVSNFSQNANMRMNKHNEYPCTVVS